MNYKLVQAFWLCAVLGGVSACGGGTESPIDVAGGLDVVDGSGDDVGGGGGGVDPPLPSPFTAPTEQQALFFINDMPAEFASVRDNHNTGGFTPYVDLPRPSMVSYDGFMEVAFFSSPGASVRSPTTLNVDMMSGAMTGDASAFMGMVLNSDTGLQELALYEGVIAYSGGSLTADSSGNTRMAVQIDGTLNNGLQDFAVEGTLDGRVYGADADGIFANGSYFGGARDMTLTADGVDVYGSATLWALKQ